MKVNSVRISNFRKFKVLTSFEFDQEMVFVGKNNSGKTSIFEAFNKFLTSKSKLLFEDFSYDSFSPEKIDKIYELYLKLKEDKEILPIFLECCEKYFTKICLDLFISFEDSDDFSVIKPLFFEFENNEKCIILCRFEIASIKKLLISYEKYLFEIEEINKIKKGENKIVSIRLFEYLIRNFENHYQKSFYVTKKDSVCLFRLDGNVISTLFNIDSINARRDVDDTSDQKAQNISMALWEYYTVIKNNNLHKDDYFRDAIETIKNNLDDSYDFIFEDFLKNITENILLSEDTMRATVTSDFDIEMILQKNSKLKYILGDTVLNESYNGLGFSNLIYIFIRVKLFLLDVKKRNALVNILFIEEPESHLHPQIQISFFEKIRSILDQEIQVYRVISTHSSYILASSEIESIRYFCANESTVKIKSLNDFVTSNQKLSLFLKKYFKVSNCDLFFADKAIFVEGSAERILFPSFSNKTNELTDKKNLLKQHISIIEVGGRYANLFFDLIDFLELKSLIITDIDSISNNEKCKCDITGENETNKKLKTSNPIIKEWFFKSKTAYIFDLIQHDNGEFIKMNGYPNEKMLSIQKPINSETYWGRTLEEQLIIENIDYFANDISNLLKKEDYISKYDSYIYALKRVMKVKEDDFKSLSNNDKINEKILKYAYDVVTVLNKTNFALDLIATDDEWNVPNYIKDGLIWLAK